MTHPNLEKMKATRASTRARRVNQTCTVREIKLTNNKLSRVQKENLNSLFVQAKWLYNSILAAGVYDYKASSSKIFSLDYKTKEEIPRETPLLHAHVKQNLLKQMKANIKTLSSLKKTGKKVGKLRYRSVVNTVEYSTGDVRVKGSKIFIPKIGWVRASGLAQLKNQELANARLTRKAGQYYLLITCYQTKQQVAQAKQQQAAPAVGIDMGVSNHLTLSDGSTWNSVIKESERLKGLQRKLARQQKHSNNYLKTQLKIQREYEKLTCLKKEFANKFVHKLFKDNEVVFYQDEFLRGWKPRFGKRLQHSALGLVKAKLARKSHAVMLNRFEPTTQYCPECKSLSKHELKVRVYSCPCGYSMERDKHAARNMIILGSKYLPPEQRVALVESLLDKSMAEAILSLDSVKQATSKVKVTLDAEASGSLAQM